MNLDLALTYSDVPGFPVGSAVAQIVATLLGSAPGATKVSAAVGPAAAAIEFANVAADTYTYTVSNVDAAGNVLGSVVTGSFTVTTPQTISLSLVTGAVASQS